MPSYCAIGCLCQQPDRWRTPAKPSELPLRSPRSLQSLEKGFDAHRLTGRQDHLHHRLFNSYEHYYRSTDESLGSQGTAITSLP